jgi:hypothetical protein
MSLANTVFQFGKGVVEAFVPVLSASQFEEVRRGIARVAELIMCWSCLSP